MLTRRGEHISVTMIFFAVVYFGTFYILNFVILFTLFVYIGQYSGVSQKLQIHSLPLPPPPPPPLNISKPKNVHQFQNNDSCDICLHP